MKLFDVNVLVYAHREDQPDHAFYRAFVENHINGAEAFAMSPLVAGGFVRIVTNPAFPNGATPLAQALAAIESMASLEHCHWTGPGQRHWRLMADLCRRRSCTGKRVADAQHAAIAIEHGCRWVTRDRDFEAFTAHGLQLELLVP